MNEVYFTKDMTLREVEKEVILDTLQREDFNRTKAARVLGIGVRTLQRKLKKYGVTNERENGLKSNVETRS